MEELETTMLSLEAKYHTIEGDLSRLMSLLYEYIDKDATITEDEEINIGTTAGALCECIAMARCYEIEKAKRSAGGRKAWKNLDKSARTERAKHASNARKAHLSI